MTALAVALQAEGRARPAQSACPGCGLVLPARGGPVHAFVGASPACWERYGRLSRTMPSAQETPTRLRRLIADTYAVQHPGARQRRAIQSVAVHLMGLCVLLERDGEARRPVPELGRTPPPRRLVLRWLEPPVPNGSLTIADALGDEDDDARAADVEAWARDVWAAWSPHHATVHEWLGAPLPSGA